MAAERFRDDIITDELVERALAKHFGNGNVKLVGFTSTNGTTKGDNYMGDLVSVEVKASVGDELKHLHWMVKLLKPDPPNGGKHLGRVMRVFDREVKMYNEVMPRLGAIGPIEYCPLIYFDETEGKEVLVLEHLKQYGWRDPINKKAGLTLEHVWLVVEWLAQLHGLAYVMMERHPGGVEAWRKYNGWSAPMAADPPEMMKNFKAMMKDDMLKKFVRIAEILQEENPDNGIDYVKHVKAFVDSDAWVDDLQAKCQLAPGRPFQTLCHLDPWFNNILFRYTGSGQDKPEKVLLIDFQLSAYTIPGNDLTYFLLTSTTPGFREQHLDHVLRHYHKTLHRVVAESGVGDFSYPFPELLADYELGLNIGPMLVMFALPMMLNLDPEDAVDLCAIDINDEGAKKEIDKLNKENFEEVVRRHPYLKERIKGVCDEIIRANII